MKRAFLIFSLVTIGIVLTHVFTDLTSFHFNYTISKYVGMSATSSIVFLLTNLFVAYFVWRELKRKLTNRVLKWLIIVILVSLVGLSVCPFGFYDYVIPEPVILGRTPITFLHVIFSRVMFIAMAGFSGYNFYLNDIKKKYKKFSTKISLLFVIYAAACLVCYLFFPSFFWSVDFIIESAYILFFFTVLMTI